MGENVPKIETKSRSVPLPSWEKTWTTILYFSTQPQSSSDQPSEQAGLDLSVDFTSTTSRRWRLYEGSSRYLHQVAWHLGELGRRAQSAPRGQIKTIVPRLLSRGVRMPLLMDAKYALDERLTRPATLTDVQPARPRDRVGANPRQKVQNASAHSGRVATFRGQSLRCQDR